MLKAHHRFCFGKRLCGMAIYFSSKSKQYGCLSNFSHHGFMLDGVRWASVEHYYQAQKYAGSPAAELIRKAPTPRKARKAGRHRSVTVRADWEAIKEQVMYRAVKAKFEQNRGLRELRLATGDDELIHQSNSGFLWGAGEDGSGDNRLGSLLVEIRALLQT